MLTHAQSSRQTVNRHKSSECAAQIPANPIKCSGRAARGSRGAAQGLIRELARAATITCALVQAGTSRERRIRAAIAADPPRMAHRGA